MGVGQGYTNSGDQGSLFWDEVGEVLWFEPLGRGTVEQTGSGHGQNQSSCCVLLDVYQIMELKNKNKNK